MKTVSAHFFKSTFSGGDKTCVEVAHLDDRALIRDSKFTESESPIISVPAPHWVTVLNLALNGESGEVADVLAINVDHNGGATLRSGAIELTYNADEWDAFMKGVADGQFDRP